MTLMMETCDNFFPTIIFSFLLMMTCPKMMTYKTVSFLMYKSNPLKPLMNNMLSLYSTMKIILIMNLMGITPFTAAFTCMPEIVFLMSFFHWSTIMSCKLHKPESLILQMTLSNIPYWIAFMMTLVETLSVLIRPLTLSLRLTGNMLVGHFMLQNMASGFALLFPLLLFFMFEMMVCMIQAIVFTLLLTSYTQEL